MLKNGWSAVLHDTGHFALEIHAEEIGEEIHTFLKDVFTKNSGKRHRQPTCNKP
jgi:hypothetical protein